MDRQVYKLVGARIAQWNPGGFDKEYAMNEYSGFIGEIIRAHQRGNLIECLAQITSDFCPGVNPEELYDDEELTELHSDLTLIIG